MGWRCPRWASHGARTRMRMRVFTLFNGNFTNGHPQCRFRDSGPWQPAARRALELIALPGYFLHGTKVPQTRQTARRPHPEPIINFKFRISCVVVRAHGIFTGVLGHSGELLWCFSVYFSLASRYPGGIFGPAGQGGGGAGTQQKAPRRLL